MMTRDQLVAKMAEINKLFAEKDKVDYNSSEEKEVDNKLSDAFSAVGSHAVLCLHDIRAALLKE